MLENLGFFHISSKNPVDADIANRKHYSAPAGAVTMFLTCHSKMRMALFDLESKIVGWGIRDDLRYIIYIYISSSV